MFLILIIIFRTSIATIRLYFLAFFNFLNSLRRKQRVGKINKIVGNLKASIKINVFNFAVFSLNRLNLDIFLILAGLIASTSKRLRI